MLLTILNSILSLPSGIPNFVTEQMVHKKNMMAPLLFVKSKAKESFLFHSITYVTVILGQIQKTESFGSAVGINRYSKFRAFISLTMA